MSDKDSLSLILSDKRSSRKGGKIQLHDQTFRYEKVKKFLDDKLEAEKNKKPYIGLSKYAQLHGVPKQTFSNWVRQFKDNQLTEPKNSYEGSLKRSNREEFPKIEEEFAA